VWFKEAALGGFYCRYEEAVLRGQAWWLLR